MDDVDAPTTRGHKQRARTRGRLIDAAIEVIADLGEGFAVSDVTDRAEVSNGTFYNYFEDRDALVEAVVPEVLTTFVTVSAATTHHEDAALQFAVITASALRQATLARERLRVVLRLDAARRVLLDGEVLSHLRSDLERGVADGRFSVDVDTPVLDVIAGSMLLAIHRVIDRGVDDRYEREFLVTLLRMLGLSTDDATSVALQAIEVTAS